MGGRFARHFDPLSDSSRLFSALRQVTKMAPCRLCSHTHPASAIRCGNRAGVRQDQQGAMLVMFPSGR
jgi:hypothetical protein